MLFNECTITYLKYIKVKDPEMHLVVVNCLYADSGINSSYRLKIFKFEMDRDYNVIMKEITSAIINREVKDIQIVKSPLARDDFYMIILAQNDVDYDSMLYVTYME